MKSGRRNSNLTKSKLLNFFFKYLVLAVLGFLYWLVVPLLLITKLMTQNKRGITNKVSYWSDPFPADKNSAR